MTVHGRMTRLTDLAYIVILMEHAMKENGKKTSSMAMALKHGLTELVTKVTMLKARNMESESLHGLMGAHIKENSTRITLRAKESISGQTAGSTTVIGKTTRWKVTVYSLGQMEDAMRVNILMIKKRAKEPFSGLMEESTMVIGRMASSMALVFIHLLQERRKEENGTRAKELPGSTEIFSSSLVY